MSICGVLLLLLLLFRRGRVHLGSCTDAKKALESLIRLFRPSHHPFSLSVFGTAGLDFGTPLPQSSCLSAQDLFGLTCVFYAFQTLTYHKSGSGSHAWVKYPARFDTTFGRFSTKSRPRSSSPCKSSARPHISLAPLGKVANRPRSIQTTNSSALGQKYLADSSTRPSRLKHAPSYPKCSPIFDISLDFVLTGIWEIVKSVYSLPKSTILQSS